MTEVLGDSWESGGTYGRDERNVKRKGEPVI